MGVASFDYVRAFCQAAEKVLSCLLYEDPVRGRPIFQTGAAIALQEVNVIIGVTGDLKGQVNFGMDRATARAIAGAMMMEEDLSELNEMAISALSELANMISGNATILIAESGANSDITPPSITMGDGVLASWYGIRAMTTPLVMSKGTLHLTVGIKVDGPSVIKSRGAQIQGGAS